MQIPPQGPGPTNYPRPGLDVDRVALREVAVSQRQVLYCVLGQIAVGALNGVAVAGKITALSIADIFVAIGVLIYMLISIVRLAKALNLSQVLYAILMFIPCVSLLVLLSLSGKATTVLRQAGIKVGLLGADPNSI